MKNPSLLKNRTVGFWLGLGSGVVSLVCAIVYLVYAVSVQLFQPWIFVFSLLGAVSALLYFTKWNILQLVPVTLYACAFGMHIFDRVEMFAYMATGVYGMGETGAILEVVLFIFALMAISIILACSANFMKNRKSD